MEAEPPRRATHACSHAQLRVAALCASGQTSATQRHHHQRTTGFRLHSLLPGHTTRIDSPISSCTTDAAVFGTQHSGRLCSTSKRVPASRPPGPPPLRRQPNALHASTHRNCPRLLLAHRTDPIGNAHLENLEASDPFHPRTRRRTAYCSCIVRGYCSLPQSRASS